MTKNKNGVLPVDLILISLLLIGTFFLIMPVGRKTPCGHGGKVKYMVTAVVMAIKSYETTYGLLPLVENKKDLKLGDKNPDKYDLLMEYLTCTPGPENSKAPAGNPRNIRFLDVPYDYEKSGYADPWGKRFSIYLDLDYDNKVGIGGKEETGTVFVYSCGPNKIDEEGGGDDICSWKD